MDEFVRCENRFDRSPSSYLTCAGSQGRRTMAARFESRMWFFRAILILTIIHSVPIFLFPPLPVSRPDHPASSEQYRKAPAHLKCSAALPWASASFPSTPRALSWERPHARTHACMLPASAHRAEAHEPFAVEKHRERVERRHEHVPASRLGCGVRGMRKCARRRSHTAHSGQPYEILHGSSHVGDIPPGLESTRHGIPRGTLSHAARYPARHGIPRGTISRTE